MAEASGSRRVVIVGGGFAGLFAARALRNAPVQVTLLDRAEHHLFQPLLYQCATGIVSNGKIAFPLRELLRKLRNLELVLAEVTGIDAEQRRVLARRPQGEQIEFGYDYLILAAGVPAVLFRARRVRRLRARDEDHRGCPEDPAADIRRVRDGRVRRRPGGTPGAGSPSPWWERDRPGSNWPGRSGRSPPRRCAREYRHIRPEDARVLLFDGGKAPLAMFGPKLSALAARDLTKLGVELHMGSIVTEADLHGVQVKDHDGNTTRYEVGTILWTAGVQAPPLAAAVAKATGAEQDRAGRIVADKDLTIPAIPTSWWPGT